VTAPVPRVTEALAEDAVVAGDGMGLVVTDGMPQNAMPSQAHAMDDVPDGHRDAWCAETPTGCPLVQCARADPHAEVSPPPCAVCGGTERWDHAGVWRCVTCWPLHNRTTDVAASAPGTTSGEPQYTIDDA